MGRIARKETVSEGSSNHCMWRSHNDLRVLEKEEHAEKFLELLGKYKKQHGILIHAYCLMGNHPHVVLTATKGREEFSKFWKVVNWCFANFINAKKRRKGEVVRERLRSPTIKPGKEDVHMLTVMAYTDLNPVRAGRAQSPGEWKFSSHKHYAFGVPNPLIDDAPAYTALAHSPAGKRKAYQALFTAKLADELMVERPDYEVGLFVGETYEEARKRVEQGASADPPS